MKGTVVPAVVVVALMAGAGGWFFSPVSQPVPQAAPTLPVPGATTPDQGVSSTQTLTQLHEELAAVKREQQVLKQSLKSIEAALSRLAAATSTPTQTVSTERPQDEATQETSEEQRIASLIYSLDQRLTSERDDPAWGPEAETRIATLLSPEVIKGSRIRSADCHSTLCRVEVDHDDLEAQDRMGNNLPMEPPFDGETMIQRIDDPLGPRTLMYVARQGHTLQEFPQ